MPNLPKLPRSMRPYDRGESRAGLARASRSVVDMSPRTGPRFEWHVLQPRARPRGGRSPRGSLEQALDLRVEIPGDDESGVVPVGCEKARHRVVGQMHG